MSASAVGSALEVLQALLDVAQFEQIARPGRNRHCAGARCGSRRRPAADGGDAAGHQRQAQACPRSKILRRGQHARCDLAPGDECPLQHGRARRRCRGAQTAADRASSPSGPAAAGSAHWKSSASSPTSTSRSMRKHGDSDCRAGARADRRRDGRRASTVRSCCARSARSRSCRRSSSMKALGAEGLWLPCAKEAALAANSAQANAWRRVRIFAGSLARPRPLVV